MNFRSPFFPHFAKQHWFEKSENQEGSKAAIEEQSQNCWRSAGCWVVLKVQQALISPIAQLMAQLPSCFLSSIRAVPQYVASSILATGRQVAVVVTAEKAFAESTTEEEQVYIRPTTEESVEVSIIVIRAFIVRQAIESDVSLNPVVPNEKAR